MDKVLRPVVRSFLAGSPDSKPKFSDLKNHVKSNFNMVDEGMFKEWVQREYPSSFLFDK